MNEWEAKYKVLTANLKSESIEYAERFFRVCIQISLETPYDIETVVTQMLRIASVKENTLETSRK
jgi:hypothetical protein